jgi:hypothetical protein
MGEPMSQQEPEVEVLARLAAGQFVRQLRAGDDPKMFRLDIHRKVSVPDKALATLGRAHAVAVRIRVTCESILFEKDDQAALVIPPPHL